MVLYNDYCLIRWYFYELALKRNCMPSFCLMLISDIVVVKKQCHYTNIFKPFRNELMCNYKWTNYM